MKKKKKKDVAVIKHSGAISLIFVILLILKLADALPWSWWAIWAPVWSLVCLAIVEAFYFSLRVAFMNYKNKKAFDGPLMLADLVKGKSTVHGDVFKFGPNGWEYLGNSPVENTMCGPQGCGRVWCDENGCLEKKIEMHTGKIEWDGITKKETAYDPRDLNGQAPADRATDC